VEAAKGFIESGKRAGDRAAQTIDAGDRAKENLEKKKKDEQ